MLTAPGVRRNQSPVIDPNYRRGRKPANAGQTYPPEPLTADEVGRLLAACSRRGKCGIRNRAIIVVMWRCGLRIAEALALELRDVDLEQGTITVRHGKGDKRRVVGIDPTAAAVVEKWIEVRAGLGVRFQSRAPRKVAPLFCAVSTDVLGNPVWDSYVREMLKELGVKAGIEKRVHPHGFRHTHAYELLREGTLLPIIQKQLGHSDLATTAKYVDHLLPQDVIDAMRVRMWPDAVKHDAPPSPA